MSDRVFCRTCKWWKRRSYTIGTCWHESHPMITVDEHDSCEHHERKTILTYESQLPGLPADEDPRRPR